ALLSAPLTCALQQQCAARPGVARQVFAGRDVRGDGRLQPADLAQCCQQLVPSLPQHHADALVAAWGGVRVGAVGGRVRQRASDHCCRSSNSCRTGTLMLAASQLTDSCTPRLAPPCPACFRQQGMLHAFPSAPPPLATTSKFVTRPLHSLLPLTVKPSSHRHLIIL
ncbi:hypothetical protein HaLaN_08513, partial [Haematococcus lacustris]